jgi:hypothetical protein
MSAEIWMIAVGSGALAGLAAGTIAARVFSHWHALGLREHMNERLAELDRAVRSLETRLDRQEKTASSRVTDAARESGSHARDASARSWPVTALGRRAPGGPLAGQDATLIAIPSLPSAPADREAAASELGERYNAIWSLEAQGATAEVIARTIGQPIGQVELILGLRRQIDGKGTSLAHAHHR